MRFRLQISVALGFAVLTLAMLGLAAGLFYQGNRRIGAETAQRAMAQAQAATETALSAVIAPVGRIVTSTAAFTGAFPEIAREPRAFLPMDAQLRSVPQAYSLFTGHADTGDFRQVVRLDPGAAAFGAAAVPVPPGAARVWRAITADEDGLRREWLTFLSEDGRILSDVQGAADFDPRSRDWFRAAAAADRPVLSPVYAFASSGRPGVTLSLRVTDGSGATAAVVGADLSLDSLAQMLARVRADGVGETFLMDGGGNLVAASETPADDGALP